MRIKNKFFVAVISVVLLFALLTFLPSCKEEEKLYQDVTMEVYHPDTGEKIQKSKTYRFEYDGKPKVFTARVKLDRTGKFLEDKDFENNDWKSHIKLGIRYEGEAAYIDYKDVDGERIVLDWQNKSDWPTERGVYGVALRFNTHGLFDEIKNSEKYAQIWFYFTIEII